MITKSVNLILNQFKNKSVNSKALKKLQLREQHRMEARKSLLKSQEKSYPNLHPHCKRPRAISWITNSNVCHVGSGRGSHRS